MTPGRFIFWCGLTLFGSACIRAVKISRNLPRLDLREAILTNWEYQSGVFLMLGAALL